MKRIIRTLTALVMVLVLAASCTVSASATEGEKSVNVAITNSVASLNPILMDASEVVKYATSLVYLPLVELNSELQFVNQLAESITTDDNQHFTIKINENAAWSDGTPVTTRDVEFTFLCMTSPLCGNTGLAMYAIEGTDDGGFVAEDATSISGLQIIDEKTMTITTKWPMAFYTFMNNYGRYVLPLPEHVLGDIPKDQLLTHEWFNHPTVVSGPYFIQNFDLNHYIHFVANENYWQGAPKIKYLNFNILASAQLLSGLQAGEIDLIQQTMGNVLLDDYDAIRALPNVTAHMGTPVTNQSIFINVNNVPDVRIRQALLYGIDRQTILEGLVHGNGEIVDGFLCKASPYYSPNEVPTAYDPQKAAELIAQAKADGVSTKLTWHVNSGDATFVQAASFIAAMFQELGLEIEIKTVDFTTLMTVATGHEFDVMSVEYTYMPLDPYTDMTWLLSDMGWTQYVDEEVAAALNESQTITDLNEIIARYELVNKKVQQDVPMISAYIISAMGAVSNRLTGVTPNVFGTFIDVHNWDVQ